MTIREERDVKNISQCIIRPHMSNTFLVLGAGQMGKALAYDLKEFRSGDEIIIADRDAEAGQKLLDWLNSDGATDATFETVDAKDPASVKKLTDRADAAIVAMHYALNLDLMKSAIESGCHFCDLGGNDRVVEKQLALDNEVRAADILALPDCGLAPGMANVLAMHAVSGMSEIDKLFLRVGGLPQNPKPPLNYQLFFSVGGLINEYKEPCTVIEDGVLKEVPGMTGIETLHFEKLGELEAFNTSGGALWLPRIFEGKIRELNYKTIRYPGHIEKFMEMYDMSEEARPATESRIIKELSGTDKDFVLIRVVAEGVKDGNKIRRTFETVDEFDDLTGLTAMMRTTSFPTAIIAGMMVDGQISERGVRTPDMCVPGDLLISEMKKRNIVFDVKEE